MTMHQTVDPDCGKDITLTKSSVGGSPLYHLEDSNNPEASLSFFPHSDESESLTECKL